MLRALLENMDHMQEKMSKQEWLYMFARAPCILINSVPFSLSNLFWNRSSCWCLTLADTRCLFLNPFNSVLLSESPLKNRYCTAADLGSFSWF